MSFTLRFATTNDWQTIRSFAEAVEPDDRAANDDWMANRQKFDTTRYERKHYLALDETQHVVGYGAIEQGPGVLHYRMFLVIRPGLTTSGVWEVLFNQLMQELQALKASKVWAREYARGHYAEAVGFFAANGFRETHRVSTKTHSGADVVMVRLERNL